jgi:hypothetical protein
MAWALLKPRRKLNDILLFSSSATTSPSITVSLGSSEMPFTTLGKRRVKIFLIPRPELGATTGFAANRAESIELQFIAPLAAFRQLLSALAKHRLE